LKNGSESQLGNRKIYVLALNGLVPGVLGSNKMETIAGRKAVAIMHERPPGKRAGFVLENDRGADTLLLEMWSKMQV
jgi:hypothetical protein